MMGKQQKLLAHILMRKGDANVSFPALCQLLTRLGFSGRISGDHHIFSKDGIPEILNLQPKNAKAKPYQVKQLRDLILEHHLTLGD